jgi:hypothetical protein
MLSAEVCEFTRPTNSSMIFGGWPAAGITVDPEMSFATARNYRQNQGGAIDFLSIRELDSREIISRAGSVTA